MTVIASIFMIGAPPIFLSDTLVSAERPAQGRMIGPGGLIEQSAAAVSPVALEQKCIIIGRKIWAAYAGSTLAGKSALLRLRDAFAGTEPSFEAVKTFLAGFHEDLKNRQTSILAYVLDASRHTPLPIMVGDIASIRIRTLGDGTLVVADGSGKDDLIDILTYVTAGEFLRDLSGNEFNFVRVCAALSEISANESFSASFRSHFGGLIEIATAADFAIQKIPSLTLATEIVKIEGDQGYFQVGNYLNYHYVDDLLVFRRFGSIRAEEIWKTFGDDYLVDAVYPPGRRKDSSVTRSACDVIIKDDLFNNSYYQILSWTNVDKPTDRKMSLHPPDHSNFVIERVRDHWQVHRSAALLKDLSARFGVLSFGPPPNARMMKAPRVGSGLQKSKPRGRRY